MIIDELKKANINALKEHDNDARAVLSVAINKYMLLNIENKKNGKDTTDADVIKLLSKISKELIDECESYKSAGREEQAKGILKQKSIIDSYIPKLMSEEEIKKIISELTDKSIPSVMKHFKETYAGKCDMGLVNKIARGL